MRYLFELSGEHPELPSLEAEALLRSCGDADLIEKDCLAAVFQSSSVPGDFASRISLSHYLSEHMLSTELDDLSSEIEKFDFSGIENASISVRVAHERRGQIDGRKLTRELGGIVSRSTGIDLENPEMRLRVYVGNRAHLGIQLKAVDRSQYEKRKNRFLPFTSPISIHPRLARGLINLTAKSVKDIVLDPFCGTGAFLIEAALMQMEAYGSDISPKMIAGSRRNLEHLGIEAHLMQTDVGEIGRLGRRFDCIVTDPPYGRSASTNREPADALYSRALDAFSENLVGRGRVGIIVPNTDILDFEDRFKLVTNASLRVHRSLIRNFVVLERI
ncbi:MAG TPA: methyltransferase domain-containing protein [Euryarchaeota archaeon]|nr:methyltransferase domain-containing protein [Euryarchaeota archaeon]